LGLESCSKEWRQHSIAREKLRRERACDGAKLVVRWLAPCAISLVETNFSVRFSVALMSVRSGELADLALIMNNGRRVPMGVAPVGTFSNFEKKSHRLHPVTVQFSPF
jgi:hypothetical protein